MSAVISPCGLYRWRLDRCWWCDQTTWIPRQDCPHGAPRAVWMLRNPSKADARTNDPTVRRVMTFSKREGCTRFTLVNRRAWRATDPRDIPLWPTEEEREKNTRVAEEAVLGAALIVVGWGKTVEKPAIDLPGEFMAAFVLGRNADGSPKHPLYLRNDTPLVRWAA